jgi:DNA-binding NarL/FixJ family response regulator
MIRLLLVEDHVSFAQALTALISLQKDLSVVAVLDRGDGAVEQLRATPADVAIVDLDLPGMPGVDTVAAVREGFPQVGCVVLTALTDPVELGRAVEAGASAVLHKSVPIDDVLAAARSVAAGRNLLEPSTTSTWLRALANHRERTWRARVTADSLSPRERDVLRLLAEGQDTDAIARALGVTPATAQTHLRNLRGKLGVHSRLEAVVEGLRLGLVNGPG